jgi:hypothetical protein
MADLLQLLNEGDAPHELNLDLAAGAVLIGEPPWPDIEITGASVLPVTGLRWQTLRGIARSTEDARLEVPVVIARLVAVIADEVEIEIQRTVVPDPDAPVAAVLDPSLCAACGGRIHDVPVNLDGAFYHPRCVHE